VIAAAEPRRPIGGGEDCLDLRARQEVHLPLVVALARYGEHALDQRAVRGLLERHEPEEGAFRREKGGSSALCVPIDSSIIAFIASPAVDPDYRDRLIATESGRLSYRSAKHGVK
jgi:hypothetical protein